MRRNYILLVVLFLFLIACSPEEDKPVIEKLHTNWLFKSKQTDNWHSATVPGNIFSDLLDNGFIDDPFVKSNEKKVQWVADSAWVYKTRFVLTEEVLSKNHIELVMEGIDTRAKVVLNGQFLQNVNNAFKSHVIDISSLVQKESNVLELIFEPANKIKFGNTPFENRVYTRKAQFQDGWDWGPKLNTVGIWKPIYLRAWNDAKMDNIYLAKTSYSEKVAKFDAQISVAASVKAPAEIQLQINDTLYTKPVQLRPGKSVHKIPITLHKPKLWWPHNLGDPHLYKVHIKLLIKDKVVDHQELKHGIRNIELVTDKDSIGQSFYFKVNGIPVYAKGANYIPQNSFQNKVTPLDYKQLLSSAVAANMNMLRVWGGGIYEDEMFYNYCDEMGILVWQDFMFACAMYPGNKSFVSNVTEEAEFQVKRLRNHASMALWCGNNENSEGWHRWGWQAGKSEKEKQEIWANYQTLFGQILPSVVAKNSSTSYWESSPKYGRGNPEYLRQGDAHDWWVWHDAYPFEHFMRKVPRFMSEFGFQSFPSYEVIHYLNQQDSIQLDTEAIRSHQKHKRGFELIQTYMARDYRIPKSDEDYVYVSQLLQAKGIVMGIEAQRRARPYAMGSLYWQLNDCWPAISWSSIDYFGNWKALHYKAVKAYDNVLISTTTSKYDYDTYIVNDGLTAVSDTLKLSIIDFEGNKIWSNTKWVTVPGSTSQMVYHIPQVDIYKAGHVYIKEFAGRREIYFFDAPKNLRLPTGKIEMKIKWMSQGFQITLHSKVLQKDVFLHTASPGKFSDNFFDLLPNETKIIRFTTEEKDKPKFFIKSLNLLSGK